MTLITPQAISTGASAPLNRPLSDATFGQAVSRFFRNYATFSGRASRSEFWWAYLFQSIIGYIAGIVLSVVMIGVVVAVIAAHPELGEVATTDVSSAAVIAVMIESTLAVFLVSLIGLTVFTLPILLPSIAVTVRRLHDTNRSGWWYLLTLVPYAGYAVLVFAILEADPNGARFDAP